MDRVNVESEFIENLNFLRPPVKRINPDRSACRHRFEDDTYFLLEPPRTTVYGAATSGIQSSTSLELQRPSEKVLNLNPITSYTRLKSNHDWLNCMKKLKPKNKPIIKVIVTPRSNKPKHFRKRRQAPIRVQCSLSNHESSVQTNGLFLVIGGEIKEKVFKIKTTESATVSSERVENIEYKSYNRRENINFEELGNCKILIQSLNMEGSRKPCNKATCNVKTRAPQNTYFEQNMVPPYKCRCRYIASPEVDDDRKIKMRHLRVLGEIGVNDNDNSILRGNPKENNKPASPNVTQLLRCDFSPTIPSASHCGYPSCNTTFYDKGLRTETQSTQVDFNVKLCTKMVNKSTQCCCAEDKQVEVSEKVKNKDCDSPLVIVSVYRNPSRHECLDCFTVDVDDKIPTRLVERQNIRTNNLNPNGDKALKSRDKKITVSRSGSPGKGAFGNSIKEQEQIETGVFKNIFHTSNKLLKNKRVKEMSNNEHILNATSSTFKGRQSSKSPLRSKNVLMSDSARNNQHFNQGNGPKNQDITNNADNDFKKRVVRNFRNQVLSKPHDVYGQRETSDYAPQLKDQHHKDATTSPDNFNKRQKSFGLRKQTPMNTLRNFARNNKGSRNEPFVNKTQDVGTNTDHVRAKKALVDSYTKMLIQQNNMHKEYIPPKPVNSKVTISIDGDSEHYNVLFNQDNLTTDLKIRKTLKDSKLRERLDSGPPLFNLVPVQEKKSSITPQSVSPRKDYKKDPIKQFSRLALRDSLEIFHRRVDKSSSNYNFATMNNIQTSTATQHIDRDETEFSAPVKHYTGDKCQILDPVERDRQIRELLGVPNVKTFKATTQKGGCYEFFTQDRRKCAKKQFMLNRNIQVFLQGDNFFKQKPITLTRKQYSKVKRIIQTTLYTKSITERRKKYISNKKLRSEVSFGEIRKKSLPRVKQSENKSVQALLSTTHNIFDRSDLKEKKWLKQRKQQSKVHNKFVCAYVHLMNREQQYSEQNIPTHKVVACNYSDFDKEGIVDYEDDKRELNNYFKRVMSTMKFHHESITFLKDVAYSPEIEAPSSSTTSIQTLFRGHRKSPTPNLGPSAFSLFSDKHKSDCKAHVGAYQEAKPKKPFLRRLMSCLVMRSRNSEGKLPVGSDAFSPEHTVESSIDSYHINTSLGALQMSSSMYDTSTSFYSNHTIFPVNSKMKRGFFCSVRDFLTSRKT